ncbi:MAG: DNA repair protein RecO [Candidatus Coatesbacteria bacterium]|nr:DNA repair protein RecO [Candidatus Coatesbacteria bacterium]
MVKIKTINMNCYRDIGIVLHNQPFQETSMIIRVFTKEYGILSFLIKGAARMKKLPPAVYNPLSFIRISWSSPDRGKLINPNSLECIVSFGFSYEHYFQTIIAQDVVFLIYKTWNHELPDRRLFADMLRLLKLLESSNLQTALWLYVWFVLELLDLHGFMLNLLTCQNCQKVIANQITWLPKMAEGIVGSCCISTHQKDTSLELGNEIREKLIFLQMKGLPPVDDFPEEEIRRLVEELVLLHFSYKNIRNGIFSRSSWYNLMESLK